MIEDTKKEKSLIQRIIQHHYDLTEAYKLHDSHDDKFDNVDEKVVDEE